MTPFASIPLSDLSDALEIIKGFPTQRALRQGSEPKGSIPVMSIADLRTESPPRYYARQDALDDFGLDLAQPGDVLIAVEGGTVGETLVVTSDLPSFVPSQQVVTIRVHDTSRIDCWYLGAYLKTEPVRVQLRRLARGMAIQRIPIKELDYLTVRIPPVANQHEIAERFLAFETAIKSHRAVTACLEELRDLDLVMCFEEDSSPPAGQSATMSEGVATRDRR